jgi:hypothetical protein
MISSHLHAALAVERQRELQRAAACCTPQPEPGRVARSSRRAWRRRAAPVVAPATVVCCA